jgi:hypothetical protein
MNDLTRLLPVVAVVIAILLLAARRNLPARERPWWLWAVLDRAAVAALSGGLLAWAAPDWVAVPLRELLHPTLLFLAGWVGLEIGCGLDLRVLRRAAFIPFLNQAIAALVAIAAVFAAAYAATRLVPGVSSPMPAALLVLAGVCIAGPALPGGGASLTRGASRSGFWNPSASAALAALLAAAGSALAPWPVLETLIPVWDVELVLEVESLLGRLLWAVGVGCVAGLIADLVTKDDFSPIGLLPPLAAVVLIATGIAGAVGLETLLVAAVAGFWLINATLRRLDILHVLERGAAMPRLLVPFLAGWIVGGSATVVGVDSGVFGLTLALVLLLRPAARILVRRLVQLGLGAARRRSDPVTAALFQIDELGILLAVLLTRLLEPAAGIGALAAVLVAMWCLGVAARAWEQREAGRGREAPASA